MVSQFLAQDFATADRYAITNLQGAKKGRAEALLASTAKAFENTNNNVPEWAVALARQLDHDLRAPLTAVCSYAGCLAWLSDLSPENRAAYTQIIIAEAQRVSRLVGNFRTLLEGPQRGEGERVEWWAIVEQALEELNPFLQVRGLRVRCTGPEKIILHWPAEALRQLVCGAIEAVAQLVDKEAVLALHTALAEAAGIRLEIAIEGGVAKQRTDLLAFRAAQAIAQEYGGDLFWQKEAGLRLIVLLPRVGIV